MQKLMLTYYYSENRATSQMWKVLPSMAFPSICGVLSMRMQVILDSLFDRPGSAPIVGGKKGEFRDWTRVWRMENDSGGRDEGEQLNMSPRTSCTRWRSSNENACSSGCVADETKPRYNPSANQRPEPPPPPQRVTSVFYNRF